MTILETITELLKLHGVDGSKFDRIDVAIDALYKAEMNKKQTSTFTPKPEKKKYEKKVVDEHVGI